MKKKMLIVGLIALLMAGGLVLMGCDEGCNGSCVSAGNNWTACSMKECAVAKVEHSYPYPAAFCDCN